ncbi:MAG: GTP 3',8-cyclase MoaA [Flavobacteriaceae bacterium]
MSTTSNILVDSMGRDHNYLRISLTEKCNLRCTYCMPEQGVPLTPSAQLMTADEIYQIAKIFVRHGVTKIRLTGGEPLVRKDFKEIVEKLATLDTSMALTTNAVLIDRFLPTLKAASIQKINVSLDTLRPERFQKITLKATFEAVQQNIDRLLQEGFELKLNVVLLKGVNDDEIIDFIKLTESKPLSVRFIEFMPFDGNRWDRSRTVSLEEILACATEVFTTDEIQRLENAPNDTSKNFSIRGYQGDFGVISTVTNPFCDSCNRLRLTANGRLRNCLFSEQESDLLTAYRNGQPIDPIIQKAVRLKFAVRAGLDTPQKFEDPAHHRKNRSMITIGG